MPVTDPTKQRKHDRAFANFELSGTRGVEVGPLSRPLVLKNDSEVYYVDHCSAEELKKKYLGDPKVNADDIVPIDFIWNGAPLAELLGEKAPVDYIVASHVVEHVPDLIGWLKDMRGALRDGGLLILIAPDKRFTFDANRRCSAFEEIENAHAEKRQRPGLRCIMDHFANVVKADPWTLWDDYSKAEDLPFYHDPSYLTRAAEHYGQGKYVDVHCWVFTPWQFVKIIGRIVATTGLGFDLDYFLTTQPHDLEFYIRLKRVPSSTTDWQKAAADAQRQDHEATVLASVEQVASVRQHFAELLADKERHIAKLETLVHESARKVQVAEQTCADVAASRDQHIAKLEALVRESARQVEAAGRHCAEIAASKDQHIVKLDAIIQQTSERLLAIRQSLEKRDSELQRTQDELRQSQAKLQGRLVSLAVRYTQWLSRIRPRIKNETEPRIT